MLETPRPGISEPDQGVGTGGERNYVVYPCAAFCGLAAFLGRIVLQQQINALTNTDVKLILVRQVIQSTVLVSGNLIWHLS